MTTATEKPKTRAAPGRAKATSAAAGLKSDKPLFVAVAGLLRNAWLTEEDHEHSGESDRLISVAIMVADNAPDGEQSGKSKGRAFDIAACINAARLIPGDTESPERSAYLAQVGIILAEITDATPSDVLHTSRPRPDLPLAKPATFARDLAFVHFEALCHMGCALAVLEMHADSANSAEIYGLRDLLRTYYAEADKAANEKAITQDSLEDMSSSLEIMGKLIQQSLEHSELDSVVLHAVDYLLCDAKAIADGDRERLQAPEGKHGN